MIRAVLFDVYGTLFMSAAGDIGSNAGPLDRASPHHSLESLAGEYGVSPEALREYFRAGVLKKHETLRKRTPYPELRVEELWAEFLAAHGDDNRDNRIGDRARELALRYELAVNPVYPMPGAEAALGLLRDRGFLMGLISNAQFFTPLLFNAFFNGSPETLGFDRELLIYSFEQ